MALANFSVLDPKDGSSPVATRYQTLAGATAIQAGEWVIQDTAGDAEYVQPAADGSSNADTWVGVAASTDTVTASTDGEVLIYDNADYIFRGLATTPANLTSALRLTKVTLDVTGGEQTVDENDTTNGTLQIIDVGTTANGLIDVRMSKVDHISQ